MNDIKYKIIQKYLNINFGNMLKYRSKYHPGTILSKNDDFSGIICVSDFKTMYIFRGLINELRNCFGINQIDCELIIKQWVENKFGLTCQKIIISGDDLYGGTPLLIGNCNFSFQKKPKYKILLKKFFNYIKSL